VPGVLEGIRVLDFGRYIAGPFCAALLADFGAEVIRIERLGGGEDRPFIPVGIPVGAGPEVGLQPTGSARGGGAMFLAMNRRPRGLSSACGVLTNSSHPLPHPASLRRQHGYHVASLRPCRMWSGV
jgi:hypothetical protein